MKRTGCGFLLFILLVVIIGLAVMPVRGSYSGTDQTTAQSTPTPAGSQPAPSRGATTPILGILVLLLPAGWMVWKAHKEKELQKVRAACCVPVMDEDRPA